MTRLARDRDADLSLRHLEGDPDALSALVDRYQDRLLRLMFRTVGSRRRAEDLAEEVFVRVFRYLDQFDPTTRFSAWIHGIATNVAENELLGRQRKPNSRERWRAVAAKVKRLLRRRRLPRADDRRSAGRRGAIERRRQA